MRNPLSIAIEKQVFVVRRIETVLLWAVAIMFLVLIVCYVSSAPDSAWNDAHLAPVAAWLRGYPLYTPENSGVLVGSNYPPLGFLAFLPAALISHPVPAIITGSLLAFLMNLSPGVGALMLWSRGQRKSRKILLLGGVLFLGLLFMQGPKFVLFAINVDAPAIALMLWGVIFFARWWTAGTTASLAFSAILLASVVWAKQLGIWLPPTFFLVTLLIGGMRLAIIFAAWSLATLCFWFLVLTPIVVDWQAFFFAIWTFHADHPWKGQITGGALERVQLFLQASVFFLRHYWPLYLLLIAFVLGLKVQSKQSGENSLRFAFTLTASALIAALAMLPFSLLGMVKVGGNWNSAAHSVQPVLFGLIIGGLALVQEMSRKAGLQWNLAAQSLICACLVSVIMFLRPSKEILGYPFSMSALSSATAYNESKTSNVWFPEFPLSTLLATGHLYHYSWALYGIFLAGKTVPARQIAEGIPKTPFTLKFLADNVQGTEASKMISYLKLPAGSLLEKRVGPWQEVLVH